MPVRQTAVLDGPATDRVPSFQNGLTSSGVGVGRRRIGASCEPKGNDRKTLAYGNPVCRAQSNALQEPEISTEAIGIIRSLIDKIVVTATADGIEIELVDNIAAMVNLAQGATNRKAAPVRAALSATEASSVKVVAGAGFEPTTFRL